MQTDEWITATVQHGDQYGRTLGFPTANLDPTVLEHVQELGVYKAEVRVHGEVYQGALYVGPRITLGETKRVLEIHIIDFSGTIYDEDITFRLGAFLRSPLDFPTVEALKMQLQQDIEDARS